MYYNFTSIYVSYGTVSVLLDTNTGLKLNPRSKILKQIFELVLLNYEKNKTCKWNAANKNIHNE